MRNEKKIKLASKLDKTKQYLFLKNKRKNKTKLKK
jgi:ribosomal protein L33